MFRRLGESTTRAGRHALRESAVIPSTARAAMVWRQKIGSQKWAYTGAEVTATQNGRLYLTCNDDSPSDNNGKFVVTVEIIRR
jgi:hypothetical protein